MANSFVRLGAIPNNCGSGNCCNCCSDTDTLVGLKWSVDLTNLGLINGSCGKCEQFNAVYVLTGGADQWSYGSGFFCRLEDGGGNSQRLWAGLPWNSDSLTWIGYGASLGLTRAPLSSGGCLWNLTFLIASACGWAGDEPQPADCTTRINQCAWQYAAPIGEACNVAKTLTMVHTSTSPIVQGWADQYECVNCDATKPDNFSGDENQETNEGFFQSIGAFCTGGPNLPSSVHLTPISS